MRREAKEVDFRFRGNEKEKEMMEEGMKGSAVVLLSGGLDSTLAVKMMV